MPYRQRVDARARDVCLGHTYERDKIEEWIRRKGDSVKSPKTNERLAHTMLNKNHTLKASIDEAIENVMRELRQAPPVT